MGAIERYLWLLHGVQTAILYARELGLEESGWRPGVERELAELEAMRERIITQVQATEGASDAVKDHMVDLLVDAYNETKAVLDAGAGEKILGPDGVEIGPRTPPSPTAAPRTGGWWSQLLHWLAETKPSKIIISALTFLGVVAFGPPVVAWAWRKMWDPHGVDGLNAIIDDMCKQDIALCGADQECRERAVARCAEMKRKVVERIIEKEVGGECGLLDTPMATMLGVLFGVGVGYSAMRWVA